MTQFTHVTRYLLFALTAALLLGCSGAGAGGGGGDGDDDTTIEPITITGNTVVSQDGGTTTEDASFQFTTSGGQQLSASATDTTVPVSGTLRAGDIIFSLTGSFDTASQEFSIRASGTVLALRIDISVDGTVDTSTNRVTGGTTSVSVLDTNNPGNGLATYTSTTVGNGASQSASLDDTTGTDQANPIGASDRKFWEGTWAASTGVVYFDALGNPTTVPTEYWFEFRMRVVATATQYNVRYYENYSTSLQAVDPSTYVPQDYYDVGYVEEILAEPDSTTVIAVTYFPLEPASAQYYKEEIFLVDSDTIWGATYEDGSNNESFATAVAAAAATNRVAVSFPATIAGLDRIDS